MRIKGSIGVRHAKPTIQKQKCGQIELGANPVQKCRTQSLNMVSVLSVHPATRIFVPLDIEETEKNAWTA
jgi:hypothetical protein